ncbi:hypothetical protein GCM10023196_093700 [Actinoallomurus vinaceus]|uniref:Uncharacterized protein n=1 Tax=Actinoallomurus vinaceus TaxID=1080074 RepID=A0ABP8URU7_9ACTN
MCVHDRAAKEAAVARFLRDYPQAGQVENGHPALRGITDIAWSEIPDCPAAVPALFNGLLDEVASEEASRVLGIVLIDDVFHLSAAMPSALPFLIRLALDRHVPGRAGLVDLLVFAAETSRHAGVEGDERFALLVGTDADRPERAACRKVFAEHAASVRVLLDDDALSDGLLSAEERDSLMAADGSG